MDCKVTLLQIVGNAPLPATKYQSKTNQLLHLSSYIIGYIGM
jgi:hypothetical protein